MRVKGTIRGVVVEARKDRVVLRFVVYFFRTSSLQVFEWDDAIELMKAYNVEDVYDLAGKRCWIDIKENPDGTADVSWIGPCVEQELSNDV